MQHPWLLEINLSPDLRHTTAVKASLSRALVEDMLAVEDESEEGRNGEEKMTEEGGSRVLSVTRARADRVEAVGLLGSCRDQWHKIEEATPEWGRRASEVVDKDHRKETEPSSPVHYNEAPRDSATSSCSLSKSSRKEHGWCLIFRDGTESEGRDGGDLSLAVEGQKLSNKALRSLDAMVDRLTLTSSSARASRGSLHSCQLSFHPELTLTRMQTSFACECLDDPKKNQEIPVKKKVSSTQEKFEAALKVLQVVRRSEGFLLHHHSRREAQGLRTFCLSPCCLPPPTSLLPFPPLTHTSLLILSSRFPPLPFSPSQSSDSILILFLFVGLGVCQAYHPASLLYSSLFGSPSSAHVERLSSSRVCEEESCQSSAAAGGEQGIPCQAVPPVGRPLCGSDKQPAGLGGGRAS
eukprot:759517-Hanusia_phi.AAC.3